MSQADTENKKMVWEISNGSIVRVILLVVLALLLYRLRDAIAVVLLSVVVASAVDPAARWFQSYKIPRVLGVLFIYVAGFAVLGLLFYMVLPPLFSEISDFLVDLPAYLETNFEPQTIFSFLPQLPVVFSDVLGDYIAGLESSLTGTATGFFGTVITVFGGAISFILMIVISFYLSVQERGIENFLKVITPQSYEPYVLDVWARSRRKIGWWLQGQFLLGILVGVLVFLGLTVLGVKYALLLAILSAIFELIPVFGPILSAIPAVGIAFIQAPILALAVLVLYFIVQQFENHLIYPLVVRKTIGVPPIIAILSLFIGGTLGGFFGLVLAVPVAAVMMELINDVAREKKITF